MRILIPVLEFGRAGGFRVLSNLADQFISKGHEVHFVSPDSSASPYYPTSAEIIWISVSGIRAAVNNPRKIGLFYNIRSLYYFLRKNTDRYDAVMANQSLTTWPVYLSRIKARWFYYIQAYEPDHYRTLIQKKYILLRYLSALSYSLPFTKIVNAPLFRKYRSIETQNMVLPGIDLELFYPKKEQKAQLRPWRVGTIGRAEKFKGTFLVLAAFKKLRIIHPDIELHVAFGTSEIEDKTNGIFIVNPDGDHALAEFYRGIDIYVCAGTIEHGAVHYPVIESMACGTYVITTPYYPADETNAWIVGSGNVDDIVQRSIEIMEGDPGENQKKVIQARRVLNQFSWGRVSEAMLAILQQQGG